MDPAYVSHLLDPTTEQHSRELSINGRAFTAVVHGDPHQDGRHLLSIGAVSPDQGVLFTHVPSGDVHAQIIVPRTTAPVPGAIAPPCDEITLVRSAATGEIELKTPPGMTDEHLARVLQHQGFAPPGESLADVGRQLHSTLNQVMGHVSDVFAEHKAAGAARTAPGLLVATPTRAAVVQADVASGDIIEPVSRRFAAAGLADSRAKLSLRMPQVAAGPAPGDMPKMVRVAPSGMGC